MIAERVGEMENWSVQKCEREMDYACQFGVCASLLECVCVGVWVCVCVGGWVCLFVFCLRVGVGETACVFVWLWVDAHTHLLDCVPMYMCTPNK